MREFGLHSGDYIQKMNSVDTYTAHHVKFVRFHQIFPPPAPTLCSMSSFLNYQGISSTEQKHDQKTFQCLNTNL